MKSFVILLFAISGIIYAGQNDSLVGVWQDNEVVAAGWSNTFLFFGDGSFKFFYNQMDMRKRETGFSGRYKVDADGLYLDVKQRDYLEGGKLIEDATGGKGDSVLVETTNKTLMFDPPEQMEMSISKIYTDTEYAMGKYIYIDAIKFYKMSEKPAELLEQFEKK